MNENPKSLSKKAGLSPGALVHIGARKTNEIKVTVIDYNEAKFSEVNCKTIEECFPYKDSSSVSWVNIDGLHDTEAIGKIGQHYGLHPLLLEDVLNTSHRPKVEEFDDYLFLALQMFGISKDGKYIVSEQISLVLGKHWVISFQEQEGDVFDTIRQRIKEKKGNIRHKGTDYLMYRLIDTVVDNYFFVTEHLTDVIEKLEEKVMNNQDKETLQEIQHLKKQFVNLRKSVMPLREAVSSLQKDGNEFVKPDTIRYLRDVYEHLIQVNETIDSERDTLASIMELYLSGVSNKMNQIMKILTIIATIFIPLTFIAGVYGMNFDNMPELHWKYGYFAVWGVMLAVIIIMILFFKRKRWL